MKSTAWSASKLKVRPFACLWLALFQSMVGTAYSESRREDSWYAAPSDECVRYSWEDRSMKEARDEGERSRRLLHEVPKSKANMAISKLEDKSFVWLSDGEIEIYFGPTYVKPKGTKPYLVRAIYGKGSTGGFSFMWCNEDIWVSHQSMSDTEEKENKTALVLNLDRKPRKVFVTKNEWRE